jgi:hypothetical protein
MARHDEFNSVRHVEIPSRPRNELHLVGGFFALEDANFCFYFSQGRTMFQLGFVRVHVLCSLIHVCLFINTVLVLGHTLP